MPEAEILKINIIQTMQKLCAHCVNGRDHNCPIKKIQQEIENIKGVPLIVNSEFKGIIFR